MPGHGHGICQLTKPSANHLRTPLNECVPGKVSHERGPLGSTLVQKQMPDVCGVLEH